MEGLATLLSQRYTYSSYYGASEVPDRVAATVVDPTRPRFFRATAEELPETPPEDPRKRRIPLRCNILDLDHEEENAA